MDNYAQVIHQMQEFGIEFAARDLPLQLDLPKRKTCGVKGKCWYWLRTFNPDAGGCYIVGRFGTYKHGGRDEKVDVDWKPLSDAERERRKAEYQAARERAAAARAEEAELAALDAASLWRRASAEGTSPYLARKGVEPEACRYLPDGSLVIPLLRYDLPREDALKAVQRIYPGPRADSRTGEDLPQKVYTRGFSKPGCALRLGTVEDNADDAPAVVLVCEGYATGLTLRMATDRRVAVYVALDAGNLQHVVPLVADLHPDHQVLICADDDWKTCDPAGKPNNPGRTAATEIARQVEGCDIVYPVFAPLTRQPKDTDFNDLHARQGLDAVRRQLRAVLHMMERVH